MPYPIFVNLQGRRCVIVGGGRVAERRAESLILQGAETIIVAPEVTERIADLHRSDARLNWMPVAFEPGALDGAVLVIAATDDADVNARVADAARARGALICRADEPDAGDFIVPAVVERGDLTIALSTSGASPTLAAVLIARVRTIFGPEWEALTALFARLRPEIQRVQTEQSRREIAEAILRNQSVLDSIQAGDMDAALAEAKRCI